MGFMQHHLDCFKASAALRDVIGVRSAWKLASQTWTVRILSFRGAFALFAFFFLHTFAPRRKPDDNYKFCGQ